QRISGVVTFWLGFRTPSRTAFVAADIEIRGCAMHHFAEQDPMIDSSNLSRRTLARLSTLIWANFSFMLIACQEPPSNSGTKLGERAQPSEIQSLHVSIEPTAALTPERVQALSAALEKQAKPQNVMVQRRKDASGVDRIDIDLVQTASSPEALRSTIAQ